MARPSRIEPGRPDVLARAAQASDAIKVALWRELRRQPIALRRLSHELGRTSGFLHNLLDTRPARRNVGLRVEDLFALCELLELDPVAFLARLQRRGAWEDPPAAAVLSAEDAARRPAAHPAGAEDLEEGILRLARGLMAVVQSSVERSCRDWPPREGAERSSVVSSHVGRTEAPPASILEKVQNGS